MTLGTWASGGFIVVDATNMPGAYTLGVPDAALASGAKWVIIMIKGATNLAPIVLEIELVAVDNQDAVRNGLSSLPNAAAAATGGLPTVDSSNAVKVQSGTSANQISLSSGLVTLAGVTHTGAVIPTVTTTTTVTDGVTLTAFNAKLGTPAGASVSVDIAAIKTETSSIQTDTNDLQTQVGTAGAGLTAVASQASVNTIDDFLDTEITAIKAKTDLIPAAPAAVGDVPSAANIATAVWGFVTASTYTATQVMRLLVSVMTGKSSGGGTTTVVFRDIDDTKDRVIATVDSNGNRTSVVRDVT